MIRLRKTDQSSFDVNINEVPFVEIVNDLDGTVMVLVLSPEPGRYMLVYPGTEEAIRYAALMKDKGVKFSPMVINRKSL